MQWNGYIPSIPANGEYVGPWQPGDGSDQIGIAISTQDGQLVLEGSLDGNTVDGSAEVAGNGYRQATNFPTGGGHKYYRIRYENGATADEGVIIGITTASPAPPAAGAGDFWTGQITADLPIGASVPDFSTAAGISSSGTSIAVNGTQLHMTESGVYHVTFTVAFSAGDGTFREIQIADDMSPLFTEETRTPPVVGGVTALQLAYTLPLTTPEVPDNLDPTITHDATAPLAASVTTVTAVKLA